MNEEDEREGDLSLEKELGPFYIEKGQFQNRFERTKAVVNVLDQQYFLCNDKKTGRDAIYKHYLYESPQSKQAVQSNLVNFIRLNQLQVFCKFIGYTCSTDTNSLTAIFEYNLSLDEFLKTHMMEVNKCQFYAKLLVEITKAVDQAQAIGLQLDDINRKNIIVQFNPEEFLVTKFKILYDERQKKFDNILRFGKLAKLFWSPQKLCHHLFSSEDPADDEGEEVVYQIGLLMLDIIYQSQTLKPNNMNDSEISIQNMELLPDQPLPNISERKRGYYQVDYSQNKIEVDHAFIAFKLKYLFDSKIPFLHDIASLIKIMIAPFQERMTIKELVGKCQKYRKGHQSPGSKMLTSHQSLFSGKISSGMIKDSLKYSSNSMNENEEFKSLMHSANSEKDRVSINEHHMPMTTTTLPSDGIGSHHFISNRYTKMGNQESPMSTKSKSEFSSHQLLKNCSKEHHSSVVHKLDNIIIEILRFEANGYSVQKKQYYDGSFYWGQLNPNKRDGLGIYGYKTGEVYFGTWKQNTLIDGTYLFKNGQSFEGVAKNGKQGFGKYHYANGNIYEGEWKDDLKNGKGNMKYPSGSEYDGEWEKGKKHGRGIYCYDNGMKFDGNFALGRKYGDGSFEFPNGTRIVGFWDNNHLEGKGKIYYSNGDYYEGNFHLSEKSGQGTYQWAEDRQIGYMGQFKKDNLEGYATIRFKNNQQYIGKVKNGKRDGQGTYYYENGDKFQGEWKNDQKVLGTYTFKSGEQFEGKFKGGEIAFGKMVYLNDEEYHGEFRNGERHGLGKYTNRLNTVVYEGVWENDEFMGQLNR